MSATRFQATSVADCCEVLIVPCNNFRNLNSCHRKHLCYSSFDNTRRLAKAYDEHPTRTREVCFITILYLQQLDCYGALRSFMAQLQDSDCNRNLAVLVMFMVILTPVVLQAQTQQTSTKFAFCKQWLHRRHLLS
jgi:hypothetical protein